MDEHIDDEYKKLGMVQDKLTQMRSDKILLEVMFFELNRAKRFNHPLSFLLIEPKLSVPYENNLLHLYPILKQVSMMLRQYTRYVDISIRMGRQLLLILTETDPDGAKVVESKLKDFLEGEPLPLWDEFPMPTVSLLSASASFPKDGNTPEEVLQTLQDRLEEQRLKQGN